MTVIHRPARKQFTHRAIVVDTSCWSNRAWMMRISMPRCSKWVAKLCREVYALIRLVSPALCAATLMDFLTMLKSIWCRRTTPVRRSVERSRAGNTYCQPHSFAAFEYLRAKMYGIYTYRSPVKDPARAVFIPSTGDFPAKEPLKRERSSCGPFRPCPNRW